MLRIQRSITEMAQEESSAIVIRSILCKNIELLFFDPENGGKQAIGHLLGKLTDLLLFGLT